MSFTQNNDQQLHQMPYQHHQPGSQKRLVYYTSFAPLAMPGCVCSHAIYGHTIQRTRNCMKSYVTKCYKGVFLKYFYILLKVISE